MGDTGQDWKEEARGSHSLYVCALEGPPMLQDAGPGGKWGPDAALSWEPWLPFNLLLFFLCPIQLPTLWIKFPFLRTFRMWHTLAISALGR